MKRILVTGASGFIGRHVIEPLLRRGFEVHGAALAGGATSPGVTWHLLDLLAPGTTESLVRDVHPSHLLHLAWVTEHGRFWASESNARWLETSVGLIREFVAAGGRRILSAGTCAEYDWRYGYCVENLTPLTPGTLYGAAKCALGQAQAAICRQSGVSAAWGRVFHLFGPHEDPRRLIPSVVRALLRGEPALCSHGEQVRDFLHVQEVAEALAALLDSDVEGAVNIGSGRGVTVGELTGLIAAHLGRSQLLRLGALPAPADDPPFLVASVRRLREEVGWRPSADLPAALANTIEWWRTRNEQQRQGRGTAVAGLGEA